MKLYVHYCSFGFNNCYVMGIDDEAIIIDPGRIDSDILDSIEKNNYRLRAVLVTHDHSTHVYGLRTLERIYRSEIYAVNPMVADHKTGLVKDGDVLALGPFRVAVISVPGHSADSAVFKIEHLLFTGDALTAALVGSTQSFYGEEVQIAALRNKIFALPGDYVVLPGHGPPSTLEAERRFNAGIQLYEKSKTRRPAFKVDIWE